MSALNKSEKTKKSRMKRDPHKLLEKEEVAGVVDINCDTVLTGNDVKELKEKARKVAETGTILMFFLELQKEMN